MTQYLVSLLQSSKQVGASPHFPEKIIQKCFQPEAYFPTTTYSLNIYIFFKYEGTCSGVAHYDMLYEVYSTEEYNIRLWIHKQHLKAARLQTAL